MMIIDDNSTLSVSINYIKKTKRFDCPFLIKIAFFNHFLFVFSLIFQFFFFSNLINNLSYIKTAFKFHFPLITLPIVIGTLCTL